MAELNFNRIRNNYSAFSTRFVCVSGIWCQLRMRNIRKYPNNIKTGTSRNILNAKTRIESICSL